MDRWHFRRISAGAPGPTVTGFEINQRDCATRLRESGALFFVLCASLVQSKILEADSQFQRGAIGVVRTFSGLKRALMFI